KRVKKNYALIEAYGTVDELNSQLGMVRALQATKEIEAIAETLQADLFVLGADLATPLEKKEKISRINESYINKLENWIDELDATLSALTFFILPSGTPTAAGLHICRTVCRRAERLVISASEEINCNPHTITYLNRLSDLFFVMA